MNKLNKLFSISMLCLLLLSFNQVSATDVSEPISTNTNWTKADSPYVVLNDVAVEVGATLTIDAGVEVRFKQAKSLFRVSSKSLTD